MEALFHYLRWGVILSTILLLQYGCTKISNEKKDSAMQGHAVIDSAGINNSKVITSDTSTGIVANEKTETIDKNTTHDITASVRRTESIIPDEKKDSRKKEKSSANKTEKQERSAPAQSSTINDPKKTTGDNPKKTVVLEPTKVTKPDLATPEPENKNQSGKTSKPDDDMPVENEVTIKKEPENNTTKSVTVSQSNNWVVPESASRKSNPVASNTESLKIGKSLYLKHCASCHGKKGLGDGPKAAQLDTHSGDFTTKTFQSQTDGAIFYKTKEGRDDMPSFKKKIPDDEDIWNVVNFLRTFK